MDAVGDFVGADEEGDVGITGNEARGKVLVGDVVGMNSVKSVLEIIFSTSDPWDVNSLIGMGDS